MKNGMSGISHGIQAGWMALLLISLAACQQPPAPGGVKVGKPYVIDGKTYYPSYDPSYDKIGEASWYGPGFHGKYTANGETFDQNDLTAAHPTLPMPSLVRVTNLETGKSAILRINDRGPFTRNRIIDLSKKSAETLGMKSIARVRVQFLKEETEQYIASMKSGTRMSMAQINEKAAAAIPKPSQIVEATNATTHTGQIVSDAAPVMKVSSDEVPAAQTQPPAASSRVSIIPSAVAGEAPPEEPIQTAAVIEEKSLTPAAGEEKPAASTEYVPPVVPYSGVTVLPNETIVEAPPAETVPAATISEEAPAPAENPAEKQVASLEKPAVAEKPAATGNYAIQVGSFASEENARKIADKLTTKIQDGTAAVDTVDAGGKTWWRVRVTGFTDKASAASALGTVHASGAPDARVIRQ
jgi:rare lipoprotein A